MDYSKRSLATSEALAGAAAAADTSAAAAATAKRSAAAADADAAPAAASAANTKHRQTTADDSFVAAMRKATRGAHNVSNVLILAKLAVALTDRRLYAKALAQFLPVYAALEAGLKRHSAHPALEGAAAALDSADGSRADAMRRDLEHWLGPDWRALAPASAAAAAYADHLAALADGDEPALLLPYVWALHVPVLLPFMRRRIASGLGVPEDGPGVEFFSVSGQTARLNALRAAVNRAGGRLAPPTRDACLAHAVEQFRRNNAVVRAFKLPLPSAVWAVARASRRVLVCALLAVVAVALALQALQGRARAGAVIR